MHLAMAEQSDTSRQVKTVKGFTMAMGEKEKTLGE